MRQVLGLKQPSVHELFYVDDHFELLLRVHVTSIYLVCLFAGKTKETEFTSCWKPFVGARVRMTNQLQCVGGTA